MGAVFWPDYWKDQPENVGPTSRASFGAFSRKRFPSCSDGIQPRQLICRPSGRSWASNAATSLRSKRAKSCCANPTISMRKLRGPELGSFSPWEKSDLTTRRNRILLVEYMLQDWEFWFQLSDGDKDLFREFLGRLHLFASATSPLAGFFFRYVAQHHTTDHRDHPQATPSSRSANGGPSPLDISRPRRGSTRTPSAATSRIDSPDTRCFSTDWQAKRAATSRGRCLCTPTCSSGSRREFVTLRQLAPQTT